MGQVPACSIPEDHEAEIVVGKEHWRRSARRAAAVADLFGILEITGAPTVGAATRLAVAEALASVAGKFKGGRGLNVEVARCPTRPGAQDALRFAYSLRSADSKAVAGARASIERELARSGTSRLIPRFIRALEAHGERCLKTEALRKVTVTEWTLKSAGDVTRDELTVMGGQGHKSFRLSERSRVQSDAPMLFSACATVPIDCSHQDSLGLPCSAPAPSLMRVDDESCSDDKSGAAPVVTWIEPFRATTTAAVQHETLAQVCGTAVSN